MNTTLMDIADAFFLILLFGIPVIAGGVGFAASKGWPKNFSRIMYLHAFWGLGLVSAVLVTSAQRMLPDDVWHQLLQEVCGALGLLLFGVSIGCAVGIFTSRYAPPSPKSYE